MTTAWRSSTWLLLGASLILALSLGTRHGFGLFLPPMSAEFGWGREVFAFAIALQNLIWGLAQPITGALADRFGARKAVVIGGVLLTGGAGSIVGIVLGTMTFAVVNQGVFFAALDPNIGSIIVGALLLAAVLSNDTFRALALSAATKKK